MEHTQNVSHRNAINHRVSSDTSAKMNSSTNDKAVLDCRDDVHVGQVRTRRNFVWDRSLQIHVRERAIRKKLLDTCDVLLLRPKEGYKAQ